VQTALRAFAVHSSAIPHDHKYNLENSCLVGVDLSRPKNTKHIGSSSENTKTVGSDSKLDLQNVRLSQAILLHVNFSNVDLTNAELVGVTAGDWHNSSWSSSPFRHHLHEKDSSGKNYANPYERRKYVSNFSWAVLQNANLQGAGFEGADFSHAKLQNAILLDTNISRANFEGVADLDRKQISQACVGKSSEPLLEEVKPILPDHLKNVDIPRCATADRGRKLAAEHCSGCHSERQDNDSKNRNKGPSYRQMVRKQTPTREYVKGYLTETKSHDSKLSNFSWQQLGDFVRYFEIVAQKSDAGDPGR
jgi:uncharacterized protein YjbI with pentapeptide repeats